MRSLLAGMITHFPLLPARPHDVQLLDDLVDGFADAVPVDKGFIDQVRQRLLLARGVVLLTPLRRNMTATHPPKVLRLYKRLRKRIETVVLHLTERFAMARIRVRDLWHFQHRIIRKVLAHTHNFAHRISNHFNPNDRNVSGKHQVIKLLPIPPTLSAIQTFSREYGKKQKIGST